MAAKSYKKRGLKNRRSRKGQRGGGDGGATGYVGNIAGSFEQQMNNAGPGNLLHLNSPSSISPASIVESIQTGGRRKSRKNRKYRKKLRGGSGLHALNPADLSEPHTNQHMNESTGQKGGYYYDLLERAVVPFGLIGLQRLMGKRARSLKNKQ
jgi:hypothetical protein